MADKDKKDSFSKLGVFSFLLSSFSFIISITLFSYQYQIYENQVTPFPNITKAIGRLEKVDSKPYLTYYYYGKNKTIRKNKNFEKAKKIDLNKNPKDKVSQKFIEECQKNKGKTYFTRFNGTDCLVVNNLTNNKNFVMEYCSAELHIKNYGALIKNSFINYVSTQYNEEAEGDYKNKFVKTKANKNKNEIPLVIKQDESIVLYYCQITTELKGAQCVSPKKQAEIKKSTYDLLKMRVNKNIYNYDNVTFNITCENMNGKEFEYDVILDNKGNFFKSGTKYYKSKPIFIIIVIFILFLMFAFVTYYY